jgi:hypothetical protein
MEEELSIAMNYRASGGQTIAIDDICGFWAGNMKEQAFGGDDRGVLIGEVFGVAVTLLDRICPGGRRLGLTTSRAEAFYKELTKARLHRDNLNGGCGYGGGAVRGPESGVGAVNFISGLNALENVAKRE